MAAWARGLEAALREERPSALVMHYASFAYAHRGIPLFLGPALRAARRCGAPLIALMHELAYPLPRRRPRVRVGRQPSGPRCWR